MKRPILIVAAVAFVAALVPLAAEARCASKPPPQNTAKGYERIQSIPVIVYGTFQAEVPQDAHGVWSVNFYVKRWYAGNGPRVIEITSYGDLNLRKGYEKPGSALAASRRFIASHTGTTAVLYGVKPDNARGRDKDGIYAQEYATSDCLYNVFGDKDAKVAFGILARALANGGPLGKPSASATPSPSIEPTTKPHASGPVKAEGRSGPITRAAGLIVLVGAGLWFYRSTKSPLFERWR